MPGASSEIRNHALALLQIEGRAHSARLLAAACGAEELIVFVEDAELKLSLPVTGFPKTFPQGRRWREFVQQVQSDSQSARYLPHPNSAEEVRAEGISEAGGAVFVFLGGELHPAAAKELRSYAPFLDFAFKAQQTTAAAQGRMVAAQQAAAKADALTQRLDVTRAELQAALLTVETANRAKDEFLAMVSHELRTPLNAILGWASLLRMGRTGSFTAEQALETIELNAQAQARLIEDLLDYSRIAAGRLALESREVSIATVIDAAVDTVQLSARAKNIKLFVALVRRGMNVIGDPDRLQQVVWNLLSNAIKFTPEGGRVEVTCEGDGKHLFLAVRDTGSGIDPGFVPEIFDRFRQADSSSTRRFAGLGLGLAITRHLVELHGGTIEAANAPGGGALFTVQLPLAHAIPRPDSKVRPAPSQSGSASEFADLSGVEILLVEDEADSLEMLKLSLLQANATVRACGSVKEALHSLLEGKPDVVISDISMPGEDGYSLIRKLRALEHGTNMNIPAIALTSHASRVDRDNALAMGFQLHIAKPVYPAQLVQAVYDLLHLSGLPGPS